MDLDGLHRPFPEERDLGRALVAAAKREGLPARCGVASSKLAARWRPGFPTRRSSSPKASEPRFLAPLPLSRLALEMGLAATLYRWGLSTVGDFAKLPEAEVAAASARRAAPSTPWPAASIRAPSSRAGRRPASPRGRASSGRSPRSSPSSSSPPRRSSGSSAASTTTPPGACSWNRAVARSRRPRRARISLPAPTRDTKTLLSLLRLSLESKPPGAPVSGFSFTAHPDAPRPGQLTLFGPAEISPDKLATAMARLFSLLGEGRVGSPRTVDGHRPERFALVPWAPPPAPVERRPPRDGRGLLAVRVLRPPLALEVIVEGNRPRQRQPKHASDISPRPVSLKTLAAEPAKGTPEIAGAVRVASGPWHLEEAWWTGEGVARDYWDVELSAGPLCRIYRDTKSGDWFADGVYD